VFALPEYIALPEALDLSFDGFAPKAFAILERLRLEPHIEQYRKEKDTIRTHLTEPFKRYRDDLVVNWVLPKRLPFETERNVFSRLLKNDFGAGGCHHHLWMSFYRPGLRRLTDVQLAHTIRPEGFDVSLFVGGRAQSMLQQAKARMGEEEGGFLALLNPLFPAYHMAYRYGGGEQRVLQVYDEQLVAIPDDLHRADALWIRRRFEREDVITWGGNLVAHTLGTVQQLWPLYLFLLEGTQKDFEN
jgi:hypothetical protein